MTLIEHFFLYSCFTYYKHNSSNNNKRRHIYSIKEVFSYERNIKATKVVIQNTKYCIVLIVLIIFPYFISYIVSDVSLAYDHPHELGRARSVARHLHLVSSTHDQLHKLSIDHCSPCKESYEEYNMLNLNSSPPLMGYRFSSTSYN